MKTFKIAQTILATGLLVVGSSAMATTYSGAFDTTIPDNELDGISSTISIADSGVITGLTLDLQMDHTWIGDLIMTLTSANGTSVTLLNRPGVVGVENVGTDADFFSINFDDANVIAAQEVVDGDFPDFAMFLSPTEMLSTLVGESITGDWTLTISDNAPLDENFLEIPTWSLNIETTTVPVPAAVWLMLTALGSLGLLRRREK